jgi:hypothetical protein
MGYVPPHDVNGIDPVPRRGIPLLGDGFGEISLHRWIWGKFILIGFMGSVME